ncbi:DHHW family protein [uncultured Clostridium sp.]|uniref:DHHW family protein n=1 Tax=uncultured Clostridium sp. TaxID=59620 RepID=UPI00263710DE|nr:DHHW family protein [uncultured Clostridium sp.]
MKGKSLVYIFFGAVAIISVFDVVNTEKVFSDIENRFLKKKPRFNTENLVSGDYTKDYEEYINDNFIGRDSFINLKSISESVLLKLENNNIVYGKYGYMFEKKLSLDEEILSNNIKQIDSFISQNENASLMMVPYSASVYTDYYTGMLQMVNEYETMDDISKYVGSDRVIDVDSVLRENKKFDNIYYKTDHHWTTNGAYLAYIEYCKNKNLEAIDINSLKENKVDDFLGTFYSKSKLINAQADNLIYYDMSNLSMKIDGKNEYESIYKLENLEKRDKYSVFLDGNHSKVTIKNDNLKNDKKLLVIKDSFANSMIPFLANNYEEVIVLDLRHFNFKISEFLDENKFDDILVLYSLDSLSKDKTIAKIKF